MSNYSKLGYHIVNDKSGDKIQKVSLEKIKKNLDRFGISTPVPIKDFEEVDLDILEREKTGFFSYEDLILSFAEEACGEDISLIEDLHQSFLNKGIPTPPELYEIKLNPGWSEYDFEGKYVGTIDAPDDKALVFDTETFVKGNSLPIIATATGKSRSYIWIAREFIKYTEYKDYDQLGLVPLPNTKVIIGHNINYDLCRVKQAYRIPVEIKSLDTLSMHVVSNGLCSQQRYYSLLEQKDPSELNWRERAILKNPPTWLQNGTTNSLVAVYNFHVANEISFFGEKSEPLSEVDKEIRDVFVKTNSMNDFVDMGDLRYKLLHYASKDSYYTSKIFEKLYPKYREVKPSKVALAGHLLLSTSRVPLAKDWDEWINGCETLLANLNNEVSDILMEECHILYENWASGDLTMDKINNDHFLSQMDWSIKRKKVSKSHQSPIREKLQKSTIPTNLVDYYNEVGDKIFKGNYDYYPTWYSKIIKIGVISPKTEISHLLLRLRYDGHPLYKHKTKGWGYFKDETFTKVKSYGVPGKNIGNVLSKDYIGDMENGVLTGEHPKSKRIFEVAIQTSFWISTRSRVIERFYMNTLMPNGTPFKMMCPQPTIHGTISGRVTESLFLVLCSTKYDKLGSETKSKVQAPDGYSIVNADFDGEELVLASLYGDRKLGGILGSCPLTYRTLNGTKEEFTDIHSATAYDLFLKPKGYKFIDGEWYIEEKDT